MNEVILSIGMIVKNEESNLKKCLDSLRPLMDQVNSELIIADTGSTDNSVSVADQFTSNVFRFEWNDDFAEARNFTIEKSRGKWYMFIDADEYFGENISEIACFFNDMNNLTTYNCASILIRSYINTSVKPGYRDCRLTRFFRLNREKNVVTTRFAGKIHEAIPVVTPSYSFRTILHHSGYFFKNAEENFKKKERNLRLLRNEYVYNKNDLRLLSLLIDSSVIFPEETKKHISNALAIITDTNNINKTNVFFSGIIIFQAVNFYRNFDSNKALEIIDIFFSSNNFANYEKSAVILSIYYLKSILLYKICEYEKSYETIIRYKDIFRKYLNKELIFEDIAKYPYIGFEISEYNDLGFIEYDVLIRLFKIKSAQILLENMEIDNFTSEEIDRYIFCLKNTCELSQDYSLLINVFNLYYNKKSFKNKFLEMMESIYYSQVVNKKVYLKYLSQHLKSCDYLEYIRLLNADKIDVDSLYRFIDKTDNWNIGFSEAIFLAMEYNVDSKVITDKIDSDRYETLMFVLSKYNPDFAKIALIYSDSMGDTISIKEMLFFIELLKNAVSQLFSLTNDEKLIICERFCLLISSYVNSIYNQELMNDEDVCVLPSLHQFGYYIGKAQKEKYNSNYINSVKYIKKALYACEEMSEVIKVMLIGLKESFE